ncbi:enoyl-CoA hydratase/isomerase family protein [Pseudarthrobacter sulfonivorans]|uniref:enoyl-CoA hydratase/isomerase family protein n=1 Tax=Pseudarthrobacter sulfonivorans TaxID=121292 RepID=UPI002786BBC6|nr:enoyl-CoA hydratase-related protein [Pseudarthrobacter sulfonivorans]MDQ0000724.1 enoyl-CoA hydratase/carnithine racemase [Pseudarthrobacter sulfonivorans]
MLTALNDGVLVLTLNDPARRNPLSTPMVEQLITTLTAAAADDAVRALVLTGADGAFSSGGDLAAMPPASREASDDRMDLIRTLVSLISESSRPTVAAIEGPAAGISVGLAAVCDVVVMAEGARMLFPFTRLGLVPDGGLMSSLPRRIGQSAAKRVLLFGNPVGTDEAVTLGLADEATPAGLSLQRAVELAGVLAGRASHSLAAIKGFFAAERLDLDAALAAERRTQRELYFSNDFAEGKAAFFARRNPRFTGK